MLFHPEFIIGFVSSKMRNLIMWAVETRSWHRIGEILSILVKKAFLTILDYPLLHFLDLFSLLFDGLLEAIGSDSGFLSFLLFSLDLLDICILFEIEVYFDKFSFLFLILEFPWFLAIMYIYIDENNYLIPALTSIP